jgi:hypothetical protein
VNLEKNFMETIRGKEKQASFNRREFFKDAPFLKDLDLTSTPLNKTASLNELGKGRIGPESQSSLTTSSQTLKLPQDNKLEVKPLKHASNFPVQPVGFSPPKMPSKISNPTGSYGRSGMVQANSGMNLNQRSNKNSAISSAPGVANNVSGFNGLNLGSKK